LNFLAADKAMVKGTEIMPESGDQAPAVDKDVELGAPDGENGTNEKSLPKKSGLRSAAEEDEAGKVYPAAKQVAVVMLALYLSLFLVSLASHSDQSPTHSHLVLIC
jgi:hypothetical protein